ncbi:hypothetical protein [Actinophytocola oryzae]|uniref:hypothetical protein n=1 Tax=Actinophytocola oryzae TaxID=502181 RepID=UPI0010628870|nr:hypothetical protein [Actinophytocola oryzae]
MRNLTTSEHERLRDLVRRSPAFTGLRVVVHEDHVEAGKDLGFGLGPVADAVAGAPADQWPDLVDDCLARLLAAMRAGTPELDGPTDGVLDRVYARLRPAEGSPVEWWTYAREVAPGLLVVLAMDHPDHVAILNDEQVRRHGLDRLLDAGMANLAGQLPDTYATAEGVYVLNGSDHVASTVLILPWVVEAVTGLPDHPHGILVAMPEHATLVFHVLADGPGARYALSEIARVTAASYADSQAPVSPVVYWLAPEASYLEPVARAADGDGVIGEDVVTDFPADFARLLQELG